MSKKTFVIFGLLVLVLAVADPLAGLPLRRRRRHAARRRSRPTSRTARASSRPTAAPATRSTRPGPTATSAPTSTNCWRPPARRPATDEADDQGDRRPRPQRDRERRRQHDHPGRMPAGILTGEQAEEVAEFVATTAGAARPASGSVRATGPRPAQRSRSRAGADRAGKASAWIMPRDFADDERLHLPYSHLDFLRLNAVH